MTVLPIFDVIKEFNYGGKDLEPGDEWKPVGGKWDKEIIDQEVYVKPRNPLAEQFRQKKIEVATSRVQPVGFVEPAYLVSNGLTLEKARTMTDEELLDIKGIGPARLKEIRNDKN